MEGNFEKKRDLPKLKSSGIGWIIPADSGDDGLLWLLLPLPMMAAIEKSVALITRTVDAGGAKAWRCRMRQLSSSIVIVAGNIWVTPLICVLNCRINSDTLAVKGNFRTLKFKR